MKKSILILLVATAFVACGNQQENETAMKMTDEIALVAPREKGGLSVNEALALRQSSREYSTEKLSLEEVSEVLWAAAGTNRPDGKLTAPSALALYPIEVYAFFEEGVYRYLSAEHKLTLVAQGDHRQLAAMQDFAYAAPLNLVYVANYAKYTGRGADIPADRRWFLCGQDAAGYAENVNLYCAANGLKSITRGSYKADQLLQILGLAPTQYEVILAQTVGK